MRVTIVKPPSEPLNGMRLDRLRVGQTYELTSSIAATLIAEGFACLEMRSGERRKVPRRSRDRRRK